MAFRVRMQLIYEYIPNGAGSALLGQQQADQPGYGATGTPGAVGAAQTCSDIVGEIVPNGDSAVASDFQTAINSLATDAYTRFTTAGSVPGFAGAGTLSSIVLAWPTGGP